MDLYAIAVPRQKLPACSGNKTKGATGLSRCENAKMTVIFK